MVREILIPTEPTLHLRLPAEFVGKTIEVLAFEVTAADAPAPVRETADDEAAAFEIRLARIRAVAAKTPLDLRGFVFDRDDANNYDDE